MDEIGIRKRERTASTVGIDVSSNHQLNYFLIAKLCKTFLCY